jgi:hypothetical protein
MSNRPARPSFLLPGPPKSDFSPAHHRTIRPADPSSQGGVRPDVRKKLSSMAGRPSPLVRNYPLRLVTNYWRNTRGVVRQCPYMRACPEPRARGRIFTCPHRSVEAPHHHQHLGAEAGGCVQCSARERASTSSIKFNFIVDQQPVRLAGGW